MHEDPTRSSRLLDAVYEAIPHLSGEDLLVVIGRFAQAYLARFGGSTESLMAVSMAAVMGIEYLNLDSTDKRRRVRER